MIDIYDDVIQPTNYYPNSISLGVLLCIIPAIAFLAVAEKRTPFHYFLAFVVWILPAAAVDNTPILGAGIAAFELVLILGYTKPILVATGDAVSVVVPAVAKLTIRFIVAVAKTLAAITSKLVTSIKRP